MLAVHRREVSQRHVGHRRPEVINHVATVSRYEVGVAVVERLDLALVTGHGDDGARVVADEGVAGVAVVRLRRERAVGVAGGDLFGALEQERVVVGGHVARATSQGRVRGQGLHVSSSSAAVRTTTGRSALACSTNSSREISRVILRPPALALRSARTVQLRRGLSCRQRTPRRSPVDGKRLD